MAGTNGSRFNDVWSSSDGFTWTQETSAAPWSIREEAAATIYNNKIWLTGGQSTALTNDVWSSPNGKDWVREYVASNWAARSEHTIAALNSKLLIFGGTTGTLNNEIWQSEFPEDISISSPMANQNSLAAVANNGIPFRLRMAIHVTSGDIGAGDGTMKIQFAQRGADNTCDTNFTNEIYSDISPSTGKVRFYNNPNAIDGIAFISNAADPVHSGHAILTQSYEESNSFGFRKGVQVGEDGLWDFSLVTSGAVIGEYYCFRAVKNDGATLATYERIPEIYIGTINNSPSVPSLISPNNGATNTSRYPTFSFMSNDYENDLVTYFIEICANASCSSVAQSASVSSQTQGVTVNHTFNQGLSLSTQYWWRVRAIDPSGSNTYSDWSSIYSFTVGNGNAVTEINGGVNIQGGTTIGQ